jgi:hypothetical protein
MYRRANGNSREAHRFCAEHYPQRRIPSHKLLTELQQRLSESRSFVSSVNADIAVFISVQSNAGLARILAGIDFWIYVDWDSFAYLNEFF